MEERFFFFLLIFLHILQRRKRNHILLTWEPCLHSRHEISVEKVTVLWNSVLIILFSKAKSDWGVEEGEEISVLQGTCNSFLSYSAPIHSDERKLHSGLEKVKQPPNKQKTSPSPANSWRTIIFPPDIYMWQSSLIFKNHLLKIL